MPFQNLHVLQSHSSRPNSLWHQLSAATWKEGTSTFFKHNVPFSYSTSPELASYYVSIIVSFIKQNPNQSTRILELGSGSGFLSAYIFSQLQHDYADLCKNVHFTITDNSPALIEQNKAHPINNGFSESLEFITMDALALDPKIIQQTNIVIMSYLFDVFSPYHLEYSNNTLYDLQVQTSISANAHYFHTDTFPPTFLSGQNLQHYLQTSLLKDHSTINYLRLSHILRESWTKVPAQHSLTSNQYRHIMQFISKQKSPFNQRFNVSFDVQHCLNSLLKHLPKPALILIYDFGIHRFLSTMPTKKSLFARYGMCQFYNICFPYLRYLASTHGYTSQLTSFTAGHSQLLALSNLKNMSDIQNAFNQHFSRPGGRQAKRMIATIQRYALNTKSNLALPNYITQKIQGLRYLPDYHFLISIALCLNKHGYPDAALTYLEKIIDQYGRFSESAFQLKFSILNSKKNHIAVIIQFKKHDLYTSTLPGIWYEYLIALTHCERYESIIPVFKRFLETSDFFIPWRFFNIVSYILAAQGKSKKARVIKNWLIENQRYKQTKTL